MISIKYDFPPPTRTRASSSSRGPSPPPSLLSHRLLLSLLSPSRFPPTRTTPPRPAGVTHGFNPFPYNFLPMHREKLARNTHAHARTPGAPASPNSPSPSPSAPSLFHALARSPALVGGHRLLDFIEFSSSARRHPVQTRIRQLTPLACGGDPQLSQP